jgi:hypothetical protein
MLADEKALMDETERLVLTGWPKRVRIRESGAGRGEFQRLGNAVEIRSLGLRGLR